MKKILLTMAAAAMVLSGCNKTEVRTATHKGMLQLQVGYAGEYNDKTPDLVPVKSGADEQAFIDTFIISIDKTTGAPYSLECTVARFNEQYADGILTLSPGNYTVTVTSPGSEKAAWDQPVYGVTKEFTIMEEVLTPVELVCRLTNMMVSVKLSETFKSELSAYSIIITGDYEDGEASLTWSSADEDAESRAGYFAVAPLTVEIQGTRASDPSEAHKTYRIEDVAAADHHILNIDAKTTGAGQPSISIDYTVNEKPVDITVPGFEEIPVPDEEEPTEPEDPDTPSETAPKLVWEANPTFGPTPLSAEMNVNLVVNAPEKIAGFKVNIESAKLEEMLSVFTMPLDLINDETVKEFMSSPLVGLPVGDDLLRQTSVEFPLSTLLPLLYGLGPEPGSEHTFTLIVTDEKGQELNQALVFYMPEE